MVHSRWCHRLRQPMVRNLAIGLFSDIRLSITKGGISQRIIVSRRTRLQTRAVPQGRSDRPQLKGPREVDFRVGQKVISTRERTLHPKITHEILQDLPRKTLGFTPLVPDDRSHPCSFRHFDVFGRGWKPYRSRWGIHSWTYFVSTSWLRFRSNGLCSESSQCQPSAAL